MASPAVWRGNQFGELVYRGIGLQGNWSTGELVYRGIGLRGQWFTVLAHLRELRGLGTIGSGGGVTERLREIGGGRSVIVRETRRNWRNWGGSGDDTVGCVHDRAVRLVYGTI